MNNEYLQSGRTNQKIETRAKILNTAQLFLKKEQAFSLEDVAQKTNISRATIYRYYSNIDILITEAALDIQTKEPETVAKDLEGKSKNEQLIGVQHYFNKLAIDHENAFRKYLSNAIQSTSKIKRGARRKKTLELILKDTNYNSKTKEDISNLLTMLMGIEPLVVAKDVCGKNNDEAIALMQWGLELILKGLATEQK